MTTKLLTVAQTAEALTLSRVYVYRIIRAGKLQAVRFGKALRIRPEDLEAFVQENLALIQNAYPTSQGGDQH